MSLPLNADAAAAPGTELEQLLERADKLNATHDPAALAIYSDLIARTLEADDVDGLRVQELAVGKLADAYARSRQEEKLVDLLLSVRPFLGIMPKAKSAKIIRRVFDLIATSGAALGRQEEVCRAMIEWAASGKMTFLRHRLELRLSAIYYESQQPTKAIATLAALLKEVRRLEDRSLLVEAHLLESRVYYAIKHYSKARAALVSARTNANAIYCAPLAQAELDMQSGVLHAEENDYKTAFSYLYEAFEGYHGLGDRAVEARRALTYMVLTKILSDKVGDELRALLLSKTVLEYKGRDADALRAIADAYKKRDTHLFRDALRSYDAELTDVVVRRHLDAMYDQLIEGHLLRLVKPYSRVQIAYLAESIKLPAD
jgi:26S proteasome regulatory subunit N6